MEKIKKIKKGLLWVILFLLIIPAIWTLFKPGYFGVSDDMHIAWLYEMDRTVTAGNIPPRFVPDLSYQFGYPLFNFVFPLPFYFGEGFHLMGFSFVDSIKIVFGLSLFLSLLGMYFLLRQFTGKLLSLLGAILYVYAPYRATDVFVRGAIGESFAFIFYPLILLSFINVSRQINNKINWKWIGFGSISISGLILSHNISAYMFIPFALSYLLIVFIFSTNKRLLFRDFSLIGIFGLFSSIYFWLPALIDSRLVRYDTVFNFIDHHPTLKQLITPFWGYGASVPGPYDGMSFFIGVTQITVALLGIVIFFRNRKLFSKEKKIIVSWSIVSILITIFMMNFRSTFIWRSIPLIAYFQFPWRFLSLTVFFVSILTICLGGIRFEKITSVILIVASLFLGLSYFKPSEYLGRMDSYYLDRYIPYPSVGEEYTKTSEEYLRLPIASITRPENIYPKIYGDEFEVISQSGINALDYKATINALNNTTINYSKYNFPGWKVFVDGNIIDHKSGDPFGQIVFDVSKGKHDIYIKFQETPFKILVNLTSLSFFVISIVFILKSRKHEES